MTDDSGLLLRDTSGADDFVGGAGSDTVTYAGAGRAVHADLSVGAAYKPLRILPFGDSITYGVIASGSATDTESGGYRTILQERLASLGVTADMVGSLRSGPEGIDRDHEGRRGYTINQLDGIDSKVIGATRPDAILLMAGTNDSARDSSTTMIADLRALIISITDRAPDAALFVASVPPVRVGQQSQTRADRIDAYNDQMPALIAELAAAGRYVHFVDMRGLTVDDVSPPPGDSGLHPTAEGYAKIADYWVGALQEQLGLSQGAIGTDQDRFASIENLVGSAFDDILTGDNGASALTGGGGNDRIDGGGGDDLALLSGAWRDYLVERSGDDWRVSDRRAGSPDGADLVSGVERFGFANGTFAAAEIANDAPLAALDRAEVEAGGSASFVTGSALANDADADAALGDALRVTGAHAGADGAGAFVDLAAGAVTLDGVYGTLTIATDGAFSYALDGDRAATQALAEGERAADRFTYRVTDLAGATDVAGIEVMVVGAGETGPTGPDSPLYTRPGTRDGSAAADQLLSGPAGANSFYFDVAATSGADRIERFEAVDVLVTSAALPDGNRDGLITFGADGRLDFDGRGGSSDGVVMGGVDPAKGLRYLGASDGLFVYASAAARPAGAVEGRLGDDRLLGDAGDAARQVFFMDTALEIDLGRDRIERFGARDILVMTTALPDGNGDRIIEFGSDRVLNLATGDVVLTSTSGSAHRRLEFDGSVEQGGVEYFVYSLAGSQAGLADLGF